MILKGLISVTEAKETQRTEPRKAGTTGPTQRALDRRSRGLTKPHYRWIVLSNTTLGVLMATINASPSEYIFS